MRNPLDLLARKKRLDDDQTRALGIAYRLALQTLLTGKGNEQAWSTLTCALNVSLVLAENGCGADCVPTIELALNAMRSCKHRAARTKRYGFTGDELRVVMAAVNIHDEQNSRATVEQMRNALNVVLEAVSA